MAANVVINDAQATPVAHTFIPVGRDKNGVFWFEDQSQANAIGYWRVAVELKRPEIPKGRQSSEGRSFRVRVEVHMPVLENVSNSTVSGVAPAPTVSYVMRGFSEFVVPERSTLQNRKDIGKIMRGALVDSQILAVLESLVYIY